MKRHRNIEMRHTTMRLNNKVDRFKYIRNTGIIQVIIGNLA